MPHLQTVFNPWLVVCCCSILAGFSASYAQSSHLFVLPMKELFDISYRDASLVPCLCLSMMLLGLIANALFHRFGFRKSIIGAAVVCTFAQVSAAYAAEYWLVVLLLGFLNGLGISVLYNGPVLVAGYLFFDHNRHKAIAVVYTGVGAGLMLLPIVFELFVNAFAFRGCLVMLAGLTFQTVAAAAVLPDKLVYEKHNGERSQGNPMALVTSEEPPLDVNSSQAEQKQASTAYERFMDAFRPHLLKNWRLHSLNGACFLFAAILAVMSSFNESILVVDYKLSLTERTAIVAGGGAASTIGLSIALLGLLPVAGIAGAIFAQLVYGITLGFIFPMHVVVVSDLFPGVDFGAAYGFNTLAMMVASLAAPVFAGWLGDATDSFRIPLYIAGFSQMSGFAVPLICWFAVRFRKRVPNGQQMLPEDSSKAPGID